MLQIPEFRKAWGHSYSAEGKLKGDLTSLPSPSATLHCHACDSQVANIVARTGSDIDK